MYEQNSAIQISCEVRERIASIFGRLSQWQGLSLPWPEDFDVQIDQTPQECAPSIAWAHKQCLENKANAVACIVFPNIRSTGKFEVTVNKHSEDLWFVANQNDSSRFFRWLIVKTTNTPDEMEALASSAFPCLDFVTGAFDGIKNMSKSYRELVNSIVHHLGVISDYAQKIFSQSWQDAPAQFASLGVVLSDENGRTKSNSNARKARTINVNGTNIIFWWHSKLEPDRDRIHFYPDFIPSGGRLLIGIFCRHLIT